MTPLLLATAFLALQPKEPPLTAGQLYDGCAQILAQGEPALPIRDRAQAACMAIAGMDLAAADALRQVTDGQVSTTTGQFCLPDAIIEASGPAELQRAFIAYVDAHPAVRSEDGFEVFERALAEKWPCRR